MTLIGTLKEALLEALESADVDLAFNAFTEANQQLTGKEWEGNTTGTRKEIAEFVNGGLHVTVYLADGGYSRLGVELVFEGEEVEPEELKPDLRIFLHSNSTDKVKARWAHLNKG